MPGLRSSSSPSSSVGRATRGLSVPVIAEQLGVSTSTITRACARFRELSGLAWRRRSIHWQRCRVEWRQSRRRSSVLNHHRRLSNAATSPSSLSTLLSSRLVIGFNFFDALFQCVNGAGKFFDICRSVPQIRVDIFNRSLRRFLARRQHA